MSDPFTLLYDAIIALLKTSAPLAATGVKYFDYNSLRDPEIETPGAGDYPILAIKPSTGTVALGNASCLTTVTQTYQIAIMTGDRRLGITDGLTGVQFALLCALAHDRVNKTLEAIKWNDRSFVMETQVNSTSTDLFEAPENRGTAGWSSLWTISCLCQFATPELVEYHEA